MNTFKTRVEYEITNASVKTYSFPFPYLRKEFIKVSILHTDNTITALTYGVDYSVDDLSITLVTAPSVSEHLIIYRETTTDRIITWNDGSILLAKDMNTEDAQMLHLQEEQQDYITANALATSVTSDKETIWSALNHRITDVFDPKEEQDVVTKHYMELVQGGFVSQNTALVEQATTQATNAKNSASSAATSASQSASSASASETSNQSAKKWAEATDSPDNQADTDSTTGKTQSSRSWALYSKTKAQEVATSATNAKSSETNAKTSETNAKTSETKAAVSATNAKTSERTTSDSASASASSASAAATSATNAKTSEDNASSYAVSAYNSVVKAQAWAESEESPNGEDDSLSPTGKTKSAKGWAEQAKIYAGALNLSYIVDTILPVGIIIEFTNNTDPNELYQGTKWDKMDGGRVLVSAGTYTESGTTYTYNLGDTGGEAKHQLTTGELASHNHNVSISNTRITGDLTANDDNMGLFACNNSTASGCISVGTAGYPHTGRGSQGNCWQHLHIDASHGHSASASNTGSNTAHENRMPYQVVTRWKRTA